MHVRFESVIADRTLYLVGHNLLAIGCDVASQTKVFHRETQNSQLYFTSNFRFKGRFPQEKAHSRPEPPIAKVFAAIALLFLNLLFNG